MKVVHRARSRRGPTLAAVPPWPGSGTAPPGSLYWFSSSSSSGTPRTGLAGVPITSVRGGTSRVTTEAEATKASSPTYTAGSSTEPPPTRAPRRMMGPFSRAKRFSVRPMKLSLVVITLGAMKTCSSMTM